MLRLVNRFEACYYVHIYVLSLSLHYPYNHYDMLFIPSALTARTIHCMLYKQGTRGTGRAVLLYNSVALCIIRGVLVCGIVGRGCNSMRGMRLRVQ